MSSSPRVAIIVYTVYGHIAKMAESAKAGIISAGGKVDIYQVPETLPQETLNLFKALPKPDYPIATMQTLEDYDAFLFGIPTRFGTMPAQWKTYWDDTGLLWMGSKLSGKYAGIFVSTNTLGGGQEVTISSSLSVLVHHGINYVPFGFAHALAELTNLESVHGGSPWGAGTLAGPKGPDGESRQPSEIELSMAEKQGKAFWETVSRVSF
ncbi:hypothetical protein AGABI2DRAFT_72455 [Agaricus bisporus var. bisporus H97]|uniref:hypothetical protein n=1 Tax=Agaricus bisporus var. bisporus (strain H97 / ATCC MYA-4626 / FGSC 10389) TaxID=936046 RepID=UPI00029F5735|nr:hypothetical protein AGABI2DRAFT_72455 [Agaricus bisporus var. bisporus H97]EKV46049.1 hypothetical protein AGABI2DRAFT_72455 [Agaricus bisporus var. bisporus H97]